MRSYPGRALMHESCIATEDPLHVRKESLQSSDYKAFRGLSSLSIPRTSLLECLIVDRMHFYPSL